METRNGSNSQKVPPSPWRPAFVQTPGCGSRSPVFVSLVLPFPECQMRQSRSSDPSLTVTHLRVTRVFAGTRGLCPSCGTVVFHCRGAALLFTHSPVGGHPGGPPCLAVLDNAGMDAAHTLLYEHIASFPLGTYQGLGPSGHVKSVYVSFRKPVKLIPKVTAPFCPAPRMNLGCRCSVFTNAWLYPCFCR